MAGIGFDKLVPEANFDWLGELPARMQAARTDEIRRSTLADLKSGDANSLITGGQRLLSAGDFEGGLKLLAEGRNRLAVDQRSIDTKFYNENILPALLKGKAGEAAPPEADPIYGPREGGPAAVAPGVPGAVPSLINPAQNPALTYPGPGAENVTSPSDAIIQAAQAASAPGAPPVQLAQAGGPTPVPVAPSPFGPNPLQPGGPGTSTGVGRLPVQAAPPPPKGTRTGQYYPSMEDQKGLTESRRIAQQLLSIAGMGGKGPPPAAVQTLMAQFKDSLDKTKLTPEQKNYQVDRLQQIYEGRGDISFSDWKLTNQVGPDQYKEMQKTYTGYIDDAKKSQSLKAVTGVMEAISKQPQFISGGGAAQILKGISYMNGLASAARALGVPENMIPNNEVIRNAAKAGQLGEVYNALSNQTVYAALGSLGNQISEGDRNFIINAFPNLMASPAGIQLLTEFMNAAADRNIRAGNIASAYRQSKGIRADAVGMNKAVMDDAEKNSLLIKSDGNLTELGKKIQGEINRAGGQAGNTPPPPPPPAGGRTGGATLPSIIGPDGKTYTLTPGQ